MKRREFFTACAATAILVHQRPGLLAAGDATPEFHEPVKLVHPTGEPIRTAELEPHRNYIFHFPYRATPCFLLDLGRSTELDVPLETEDGAGYVWKGGIGPRRSIVAYAAICAHRMSYPTEAVNFISYRHGEVALRHDQEGQTVNNVIKCCNEFSVYDPAHGARVVSGPATQPLAGILLEHDAATDELSAVGAIGGTLFQRFFEKYDFQLKVAYGGIDLARTPVKGTAEVQPLEDYTRNNITC